MKRSLIEITKYVKMIIKIKSIDINPIIMLYVVSSHNFVAV